MLLEVIGSFVAGLFHQLGQKTGGVLTGHKQKRVRTTATQPILDPEPTDLEIWNIVTSYGKYSDVWTIYRASGLLEAIKARDERTEFDQKMSNIKDSEHLSKILESQETPNRQVTRKIIIKTVSQKPNSEAIEVQSKNILDISSDVSDKLDDLDLAFVRGLASYFEYMPDKIRHYRRDHGASEEEAEAIANYYEKTAKVIKCVQTKRDLKELFKHLKNLKSKVERYKHESYKYRWSTGLKKEVIEKLEKIL
ncbi:MAG: hypothetical protein RLZZ04_2469 [Cyanobacteriota bacterium]|jgi:hypothetical protein